ncbi:DUF6602 domain-containing protein [Kribbella sp. NPDC049227]|uniref:DUF6602 domain-containing protein n=1 Tax=Kribbella sp. NPDC049227 TaxID=3364113 RepID=UPI003723C7AB
MGTIRDAAGMTPSHDLVELVRQATQEMSAEYRRIYVRTREDPGTAGDQGEENWAELLKRWLPSTHHVVTKGRILASNGQTSPQVDVLILSPYYPRGLIDKKLYLAAGVLAAFECKTTLRPPHIRKAVDTAASIAQLGRSDESVSRKIMYGLLAHSAQVPEKKTSASETVGRLLRTADQDQVNDLRDCLDFVCVADLGTWAMQQGHIAPDGLYPEHIISGYMASSPSDPLTPEPIGRFLTCLLGALAEQDAGLRPFAAYFRTAGLFGVGHGTLRRWTMKGQPFEEHPDGDLVFRDWTIRR